jgi:hypothetical protein
MGGWMSNHFGISRTFFLCGGVDMVCLGLFVIYASNEARLSATSTSASAGAGAGGRNSGNAGKVTAVGGKAVKQRKSTVVAAGAAGRSPVMTPLVALLKISFLVSPVAVAWALLAM